MHAPQYHETLFSQVHVGKQESSPTYLPTVQALETFLAFTPAQRQRTVLRTDAGFGSDANINHVLAASWQVLTKNKGGRRPQALARDIPAGAWRDLGHERWVAPATRPIAYVHPAVPIAALADRTADDQLLAWTRHWMFPAGPLAAYGPLRLTADVLCLPGHLLFDHERLVEVQLNALHPYAAVTAQALARLLDRFGHP